MKKVIFSAFALVSFAINSNAQATASAEAFATIVTPISITQVDDLNFGNIAVSASAGGTVTLVPGATATRTLGGTGLTLPNVTGTVTAAEFDVAGTANYTYAITLPTNGTVSLTGPGAAMAANSFTAYTTTNATISGTGTLDGSGDDVLRVGATLTVAAAQVAGAYSSTAFDVTVNYN